jgi:hypothetical protein
MLRSRSDTLSFNYSSERGIIGPTAGGSAAWPLPLCSYHFSRKSVIAFRRSLFEPWPKPAPAEQNCSPLFLEQFWLQSGGRLQPRVGLHLFLINYLFTNVF